MNPIATTSKSYKPPHHHQEIPRTPVTHHGYGKPLPYLLSSNSLNTANNIDPYMPPSSDLKIWKFKISFSFIKRTAFGDA